MKAKFILIPFILLIFLSGFSEGPANKLEGTWELVSGKIFFQNDTILTPQTEFGRAIKVLNKTHFATVHQDTSTNEIYSNAGNYTLSNDIYIEDIEYSSHIGMIGEAYFFESTIDGDKWTISGPLKESDSQGPGWEIYEVWKRVK